MHVYYVCVCVCMCVCVYTKDSYSILLLCVKFYLTILNYLFIKNYIVGSPNVNCQVNDLAELNQRSCTAVVRSAVDFFLRTDPFGEYCRHIG